MSANDGIIRNVQSPLKKQYNTIMIILIQNKSLSWAKKIEVFVLTLHVR